VLPTPAQALRGPNTDSTHNPQARESTVFRVQQPLVTVVKETSQEGVLRALYALVLTMLLASRAMAQADPEPTTRAEQIETERLQKAATIPLQPPPATESDFARFAKVVSRIPIGFEVRGLGPGAGPAVTTALEWKRHHDHVVGLVWGDLLLHWFYSAGAGVEFRNVSPYHFNLALEGSYSTGPQLEFYGLGPDSSIHNQTNYLREDTLFDVRATWAAHTHFVPACTVGELLLNVGPGTNSGLPTTQSVFGPAQAPGIDIQSNFLIPGCSVQVDFRDVVGDPHKGTYAAVVFQRFDAQKSGVFTFNRFSAATENYVPFFNRKRVIALLGNAQWSFHSGDQVVPFYLDPTLGSDTQLRGFARYRFYDENAIALTAEYRWEVNAAFDTAVFVDSGKVFHQPGQMSFSSMETSAGFGFRFRNRDSLLARLDFGFSHEGFQVWLRTYKLF
jgi:hypothetical protein